MPQPPENELPPIIDPSEEASDDDFRAALEAAKNAAMSAMQAAVAGTEVDTATKGKMTALDTLQGNEFHVELNGERVPGVFRVDNLTTFRLTEDGFEHEPVMLSKMVQRDANLPFNQWLRETMEDRDTGKRPTRTLDVVAVDDGEETRRWSLKGAYITEIWYDTFDSASSDLVEETITIDYESISEAWTWSDAQ
ncbi:MAG: phage tail protein [Chloroflexota bacterium]